MIWLWLAFFALITLLLVLDLGVFHSKSHVISIREATGWTVFWITLGVAFGGLVFAIYEYQWFGANLEPAAGSLVSGGTQAVVQYITAYLLEKSLSVDNIFVIAMIFSSFRVPAQYQHRVLFWGIVGALVTRGAMIAGGVWLVQHFSWIFYVFGGYLCYAGVKMLITKDHTGDEPASNWMTRLIKRVLPIVPGDHDGRFTTRTDGKFAFTELSLALITVELTDIVFAVDSIPAVLAITADPFIVVTSNVFAILGLRSLYFVVADMMTRFRYLKIALAALLVFIGVKMILHSWVKIPNLLSLGVVLAMITIGVTASLIATKAEQ